MLRGFYINTQNWELFGEIVVPHPIHHFTTVLHPAPSVINIKNLNLTHLNEIEIICFDSQKLKVEGKCQGGVEKTRHE